MSSAMGDSEHPYSRTHFPREVNSLLELKGTKQVQKVFAFTHFFRKFLFFASFLIAIPLFASQTPDFINQTILTKFWELLRLVFIGIAVSYGLFCSRKVDMEIETQPKTEDSQSYVSRVFHVSSIFEDIFNNSYGYGEKNEYQNWNSDNYRSEQSKAGSLNCEINFENSYGYGDNYVNEAWNSQYFQREFMVVVNQTNCAVNEYGHQSLGLPVGSLRSRLRNHDNQESTEISNESESGFSTVSSNSPTENINQTFGDLNPMNLENTFNESAAADALSSRIPLRSISGRMEMRENVDMDSRPSHFRPLSVDETRFESLKSHSFWTSEYLSSQISSSSDSTNRLSSSHAGSSRMENFKMDELGEQTYHNSCPSASKPENGKPSLNAFHIRRYTNGSLFHKNVQKSSDDYLKDRGGNKRKDQLGSSVEWTSSSFQLDRNTVKLVKSSSRGKWVQTIGSRGFAAEGLTIGERSGKPSDEIETVYKGKSELQSEGFLDNLSENPRKQGLYNLVSMPKPKPKPKPTQSELQKRKHREPCENFSVESKAKSLQEDENFLVKSDEESVIDCVDDAETDPSEVDKKAGEFIAKFREQIRLQKMASIDKSSRELHHFR